MKKIILALLFFVLGGWLYTSGNAAEPGHYTLQIYFSNDFNGELEPCG